MSAILPDSARFGRRLIALRSVGGPLGDPGLAGPLDHRADGHPDRHLHLDRRQQGGHLGGRATDAADLLRAGAGAVHGDPSPAGRRFLGQSHFARGRRRKAERRDHALRMGRPVQPLERAHWRNVPGAGLLRLRSIPGAAVSHRKVDCAEPAEPPLQCPGEDPDAVLHPLHRRHGVRLLHLREAAAAVPARGTGPRGERSSFPRGGAALRPSFRTTQAGRGRLSPGARSAGATGYPLPLSGRAARSDGRRTRRANSLRERTSTTPTTSSSRS